ncbi:Stores iron in a soluble, non-toxic, readily available form [Haplosporangium sp. Z 767]|nr:Stores iron in a soluble, non-toxic, readily available form [Haplosporangium sp. Z 767]KAF9196486.1 Stores iron in a soluble, non-toxic, readily available form [Haplosporangium sp. Z 11]
MSLAKQNFSNVVEDALNQQIALEMTASQTYLSIASYLGADSIGLPGLQKYFHGQADEEREHAQSLIDYQNKRGGSVVLQSIPQPNAEWSSAKNAVESALQLEKDVNKSLLRVESLAEEQNDAEFVNMLRSKFLKEQVDSIAEISKLITQLNRVGGEGLGLYLFDQSLLKDGVQGVIGDA